MFGKMFDFNGLFGHLAPGQCRLAMNGRIAVKTSNGYKTYSPKSGTLVNCSNFCFDAGDELFFSIPTNKVEPENIIIASGLPRCVIDVSKGSKRIEVLTYETNSIDVIVPERHLFMGHAFFYGRVISPFCRMFGNGKGGMQKMLQMAMMGRMLGDGAKDGQAGSMQSMMMLSMMGGGNVFSDMFDGMFDEDAMPELPVVDDDEDEEAEAEDKPARKPAKSRKRAKGGDN